jgi:hypothetical protein
MDDAERLARGVVAAERARRAAVAGAEVVEVDGLVVALGNVGEPALDSVVVADPPNDAHEALRTAEALFTARGLAFGIDLQVGRHPDVDRGVRAMGLVRIIERPGMVADPSRLADVGPPDGVAIRPVETDADVDGLVAVGADAFGDDPAVGRAFYGAGARGLDDVRAFVAWHAGEPVGISTAYRDGTTVGVMGVGVVWAFRRRGLGSAITAAAARVFPDADLAWLHPSDEARAMYERLGFRAVSDWEVWTRRPD